MFKKKLLVALLFIFTGVGLLAFGLETVKVINIPDMDLRFAINRNLNKDIDDPITKKELESLKSLYLRGFSIKDLTGLEYATNLEELRADNNKITDISCLKTLTKLQVLTLGEKSIKDGSAIANFKNLEWLDISNNSMADISF